MHFEKVSGQDLDREMVGRSVVCLFLVKHPSSIGEIKEDKVKD